MVPCTGPWMMPVSLLNMVRKQVYQVAQEGMLTQTGLMPLNAAVVCCRVLTKLAVVESHRSSSHSCT